jgi:hypothetical protein
MILIGYAVCGQSVDVGCLDIRVAVTAQTVLTQLVEMKDQDVWLVHVSVLSGGMGFLTAGSFYGSAERGYLTNTHIGLII